jgi:hypothetical protein
MVRHLAFTVGLVGMGALLTAAGCTGTGSNSGAADGSVLSLDAQGDAPTETAACAAAGGQCMVDNGNCATRVLVDCGPSAICCVQLTTCTDANVQLIQASNYDQSCTSNSDCIPVGEGNACYPCAIACPSAAINASAKGRYLSDVAKTPAADLAGVNCGCPDAFSPCCRGGTCHADFQCQSAVPAGDEACTAAGGQCVFGGCSNPGPRACGTAGMFCCLNGVPDTDASADACPPPGVCTGACLTGRHNVSTVVDGCPVWDCCVPDDAGADVNGD